MRVPTDSAVASWTEPETSFNVVYPIALFHEIDFLVNEGYRSIPYGGIEIGGLLFGRSDSTATRIEAFRTITCEHLRGPSFVLSERDIAALNEQIDSAKADPDLEDLALVGWFISHTRKDLQMTQDESALFDRFFPAPGSITVLVKPERFKPTRFGFLVRGADASMGIDASRDAIILPLTGRGGQTGEAPAPSIPAAREKTPPPQLEPEVEPEPELARAEAEAEPAREAGAIQAEPVNEPQAVEAEPLAAEPVKEAEPVPLPETVAQPETIPELLPVPATPAPAFEPPARAVAISPNADAGPLRARSVPRSFDAFDARLTHDQLMRRMREEGTKSNAKLVAALLLAAALGCAVGYWGYLQLPSAIIPLQLRSEASGLVVSWPPEQTREAVYAAIRVDDSEPRALSIMDKITGHTEVTMKGNNIKIELIAQHWMRDSRGILRYVRAVKPAEAPEAVVDKASPSDFRHRWRKR